MILANPFILTFIFVTLTSQSFAMIQPSLDETQTYVPESTENTSEFQIVGVSVLSGDETICNIGVNHSELRSSLVAFGQNRGLKVAQKSTVENTCDDTFMSLALGTTDGLSFREDLALVDGFSTVAIIAGLGCVVGFGTGATWRAMNYLDLEAPSRDDGINWIRNLSGGAVAGTVVLATGVGTSPLAIPLSLAGVSGAFCAEGGEAAFDFGAYGLVFLAKKANAGWNTLLKESQRGLSDFVHQYGPTN